MRSRFVGPAALLGWTLFSVTCSKPPSAPGEVLGRSLQGLVDDAVAANPEIPAVALHVDAPALRLSWEGAAGLADPAAGVPMTPGHPVRIASNTKTYVAAAILRLREEGRLDLDDPIEAHLPERYLALLRGDGYRPDEITLRHVLTHTSGLFDHTDSEKYTEAILAEPTRRWTRDEQVAAAVDWGDRLAGPGEVYSYCDTGYVLLGEVIERASGRAMAEAVRGLAGFERLGLRSTWWETLEPRPEGAPDRAHQFLGNLDVHGFDPSCDLYGGGGLAATVGDMARFMRGLFAGGVYSSPDTATTMLTTLDGLREFPSKKQTALAPGVYRMGVWVVEDGGFTTYRHAGFWGTLAVYVPELDLALAATVNQNECRTVPEELVTQVIGLVAEARTDG